MTSAVRQAMWSIDPDQPITAVFTFDDIVSRALARPRLLTVLLAAFGVVGLGLGALGLYGVLSFLVNSGAGNRRSPRLGARPAQVLMMVVRGGLGLAIVGAAIGLAAAFALSRLLVRRPSASD